MRRYHWVLLIILSILGFGDSHAQSNKRVLIVGDNNWPANASTALKGVYSGIVDIDSVLPSSFDGFDAVFIEYQNSPRTSLFTSAIQDSLIAFAKRGAGLYFSGGSFPGIFQDTTFYLFDSLGVQSDIPEALDASFDSVWGIDTRFTNGMSYGRPPLNGFLPLGDLVGAFEPVEFGGSVKNSFAPIAYVTIDPTRRIVLDRGYGFDGSAQDFLRRAACSYFGLCTLEVTSELPTVRAVLYSVSPNPVADELTVRYSLTGTCHVELKLFDLLGKEVLNIGDADESVGEHQHSLNTIPLPAGTYYCRLQTGTDVSTLPVLVK